MQPRFPTLNPGLLAGTLLSILLHGGILHRGVMNAQAFHTPAKMQIDSGTVSVELTLMPSIASVAAPEPTPPEPAEPEPIQEIIPEPQIIIPLSSMAQPTASLPLEKPTVKKTKPPIVEPEPSPSINSIEQAGSIEEDKGVLTEATAHSTVSPFYPQLSRRRGEEGIVVISLEISASGEVTEIHTARSSGHKRLDKAAIKAVKKAQFTPATRFGKPCASTLIQTFTFRLNE